MAQFKTIYTTKGENPAAVINECGKIEEDVIKIYLPEQSAFFEERANLELLRREADFLGKEIIILTSDKEGVGLAQAAGFSVQAPPDQSADSQVEPELTALPAIRENFVPRRFVDISGGPKRSLSELEPITKDDVVSLAELEEKEAPSDFEKALKVDVAQSLKTEDQSMVERDQALNDFIKQREDRPAAKPSQPVKHKHLSGWWKWAGAGVVVLVLLYLAMNFLPKATIVVKVRRQPVNIEASVVVDKNLVKVNREAARIPGQVLEVEKSQTKTYSATGVSNPHGKVQGTIVIYNEQTAPQAMIPSRFEAANGKIYWTQKSVVVPAATKQGEAVTPGMLEALVVANDPGEGASLTCTVEAPCDFTVPAWKGTERFKKIYAKATASLTGGSASAKVVTADDLKTAEADLQAELKTLALEALNSQLASQLKLISESVAVEYKDLTADKTVGAAADSFSLTATVLVKGIAISNEDVVSFVDEMVQARIDESKHTYRETVQVTFKDVATDIIKGEVRMSLNAQEEVGWRLTEDELRAAFRGKTREQLDDLDLVKEKVAHIDAKLWPIWVSVIPDRPERIYFTIE